MITRVAADRRRMRPSAVGVFLLLALLVTGCARQADEDRAAPDPDGDGAHEVAGDTADDGPPAEGQPAEADEVAPVAPESDALARQREAVMAGSVLEIPAIGVTTPLISLGLNADRTMEVPSNFSRAGWYRYGPTPGDPGPSVIAGHVDSRSGPAVFHRLTDLTAGDQVTVRYADGRRAVFAVNRIEQHAKDAFPHDQVYGDTAGPELRLITCGGIFDRARNSHRDNVIVYATLVS